MIIYQSALFPRKLPCPKKFLVTRLSRRKELHKLLIKLKALKPKNPKTQLKKEPVMKNIDELYEKYYNAYKNDYNNDDESSEIKKKKI